MPLSSSARTRIRERFLEMSATNTFTPEKISMLESFDAEEPGFLASLRQEAIDLRRSGQLPQHPAKADAFRDTRPEGGQRAKGPLANFAAAAAESPVVEALDFAFTPVTKAVEGLGALSAGLSPRYADDSIGDGQGILKDILMSAAGDNTYAPKIDLMDDALFEGMPFENVARMGTQGLAEISMAVPILGGITSAALETKAPAVIDVPRAFLRTTGEFMVGGGLGSGVSAAANAGKVGSLALATSTAGANALAQQDTLDNAAIAAGGTALGGIVGGALPVNNMKQVVGSTLASIPLIDAPLALAANTDIAAKIAEGEELTDEDRSRLMFEMATTGLGAVAGVGFGTAEVAAKNRVVRERQREVMRMADDARQAQVFEYQGAPTPEVVAAMQAEDPSVVPYSVDALQDVMNLSREQAIAQDAIVQAKGIDRRKLFLRKSTADDLPVDSVLGSGRPEDQGTEAIVATNTPRADRAFDESLPPWQYTQDEWIRQYELRDPTGRRKDDGTVPDSYGNVHKLAVREAIKRGEEVPTEVLRAYPDYAPERLTSQEYDEAVSNGYSSRLDIKSHRELVQSAFEAGKMVPERVAKEYPDLARNYPDQISPVPSGASDFLGQSAPRGAESEVTTNAQGNQEGQRLRDQGQVKPDVLAQESSAMQPDGPWRSNILDALASWQGKGTKQQLKAHLAKFKGANAEAEAMGLLDSVPDSGPITRERVAELAREGGVKIEEKVLGADSSDAPRFKGFQIPGGDNYREVLLTTSGSNRPELAGAKTKLNEYKKLSEAADEAYRRADAVSTRELQVNGVSEKYLKQRPEVKRLENERWAAMDAVRQQEAELRDSGGNDYLKPEHWGDIPNVVAHMRTNDRVAPNGEKVLFIEELQSDWAQDSRIGRDVPKTDFDTPSKWVPLLIKNALRTAEEGGYDRIAWTRGEQQSERYDLSNKTHSANVISTKDGKFNILGYGKDGNLSGLLHDGIDIEAVRRILGDNIADSVLSDFDGLDGVDGRYPSRIYSDIDPNIGGAWTRKLYDSVVPSEAKKLVKSMGSSVEPIDMGGEVGEVLSIPVTKGVKDQAKRGFYLYQDGDGEAPTSAQSPKGTIKGAAEFRPDGTIIIHGLEAADISTSIHEFMHVARRQLLNRAIPAAERLGVSDTHIGYLEKWAGVGEDGVWNRAAEEKLARGFERYIAEGKAPNRDLATTFKKLKTWMLNIYGRIRGSNIDIKMNKDVREAFDALLSRGEGAGEWKKAVVAKEANRLVAGVTSAMGNRTTPEARQALFEKLMALGESGGIDDIKALTDAKVNPDRLYMSEDTEAIIRSDGEADLPAHAMSKAEYEALAKSDPESIPEGVSHEELVAQAVEGGSEIPKRVLADYPDLNEAYLARGGDSSDAMLRALDFGEGKTDVRTRALEEIATKARERRGAQKEQTFLDKYAPFGRKSTERKGTSPVEFSGSDRIALSHALGFDVSAAVKATEARDKGDVAAATAAEEAAMPPNTPRLSPIDFRDTLSDRVQQDWRGVTADDINAAVGIPLGVDSKLDFVDTRARTLSELADDALGEASSVGDAEVEAKFLELAESTDDPELKAKHLKAADKASGRKQQEALVAKAAEYESQAEQVSFAQNPVGIMLREVASGTDIERGAAMRRMEQAGVVRRALFPDAQKYKDGAFDLSSPEYQKRRAAALDELEASGSFRTRDDADALMQAVEASYAGNKARRMVNAPAGTNRSLNNAIEDVIAEYGNQTGGVFDLPRLTAMLSKSLTGAGTLDMVLQAELRGIDTTGVMRSAIKKGSRALTMGRFFSSALRELQNAASEDPYAALALDYFSQQANREYAIKMILEEQFFRIMGSEPANAKDNDFIQSVENDYLAFVGYDPDADKKTMARIIDTDDATGKSTTREIPATRENLIKVLESRGVKNAEKSYPVRSLDAHTAIRAAGKKLGMAAGIPMRESYFHHMLRPEIRQSIMNPTRKRNADGSRETIDQARFRVVEQLAESDKHLRIADGKIKTEADAIERKQLFMASILSTFRDDPQMRGRLEGFRQMVGVPPDSTGDPTVDMKNLAAQASISHRRELDMPEYLLAQPNQPGGMVPVLERDAGKITLQYIRDISRIASSRAVYGGSDGSGVPTRLLAAFDQIGDPKVRQVASDLFKLNTFGHFEEKLPAVIADVWNPEVGTHKRAVVNAARSVGSAMLLTGSWFSQPLGFAPMLRDFGFGATARGAASAILGRKSLQKLLTNAAREAMTSRQEMLDGMQRYENMGLDPSAQREYKPFFSAIDHTSRFLGEQAMFAVEHLEGTADVTPTKSYERGANKLANRILGTFGIAQVNRMMDGIGSGAGIYYGEGLQAILQNPNASVRDKGHASGDFRRMGLDPVKIRASGLDDMDRIILARWARARTNFTTPTNLERPFLMRSWLTRQLYALQSISFIQAINVAEELNRLAERGVKTSDFALWGAGAGPSSPARKVAVGVMGASILAGLWKDLVGDMYDQMDPTESEAANLALQTVSELGFAPDIINSIAYGKKLGVSPVSAAGSHMIGGAPSTMNIATAIQGVGELVYQLSEGDDPGDQIAALMKTVPGIRRIGHFASSDDSFADANERAAETFPAAASDLASILDAVGLEDLFGAMAVLSEGYQAGRDAKYRARWE